MPISSDRGGVNTAPIANISSVPITPAVNDFMSAFQQGFITVQDLARRGAALPADIESSRQTLQDQIQIRPLQRQAAAGQLQEELLIQPRRASNALAAQELQSGQIRAAASALPTETEAGADSATREKSAQFRNALASSVPGVRERAVATASSEQLLDTWAAAHGQPAPETIEIPGGGVTPKPIDEWVLETYGPNALAGDAQAVVNSPEVQRSYAAYVQEAQNRPLTLFKGDPEYLDAIRQDLLEADIKRGVQAAQIKALPGVLEAQAKQTAEGPARAAKTEDDLLAQSSTRLKQFREQTEAYEKIVGLKSKPTPTNADDLALIYSYIKLLDPGSVVREGEIKLSQQATPLVGRLVQQYRRLYSDKGGILDPRTRLDYLNTTDTLYEGVKRANQPEVERISSVAASRGADVENVLTSSERSLLSQPGRGATGAPASAVKPGDVVTLRDGRRVKVKAVTATGIIPE